MPVSTTTLRRAIWKALTDSGPLQAVLPNRNDPEKGIYHRTATSDAREPFILFSKASGTPSHTLGNGKGPTSQLWNIHAADTDPDRAEEVADLIETALTGTPLVVTGGSTLYLQRESDLDYGEESWHHVGGLYRVITQ